MEIKFIKVNDNLFNVETHGVDEIVNNILDSITMCDKEYISAEIDGELINKLISRIVATEFKKQYPNYFENNSMFIKLIVPYNGKRVNVTYGEILHNNNIKLLNGVLY